MDSDRLKGTAQELGGKVQSGFGKVTGDDSTGAEGTVREVGGKAQDLYGQAKDQVRDVADGASSLAKDAYDSSGPYARQSLDALEKVVSKHPLSYLLVAAGVGYLLSLMLNSSSR